MDGKQENFEGPMEDISKGAQSLLDATKEVAGDKVKEARKRLMEAMETAKATCDRVKEKALEKARAADEAIHENPYPAIAVAFGLGAVVGILLSRRERD